MKQAITQMQYKFAVMYETHIIIFECKDSGFIVIPLFSKSGRGGKK